MLRATKYIALVLIFGACVIAVADTIVGHRFQPPKPPTPPITKTQSEEQTGDDVCNVLGNFAFIACGNGYLASGGTKDQASPQYVFAEAACRASAQIAFDSCVSGGLRKYSAEKNVCIALSTYFADSVSAGCVKEFKTNPSEQRRVFNKSCLESWAPKAGEDFRMYCEKKMAEDGAKL